MVIAYRTLLLNQHRAQLHKVTLGQQELALKVPVDKDDRIEVVSRSVPGQSYHWAPRTSVHNMRLVDHLMGQYRFSTSRGQEGWGLGCSPLASTATTNQQTGRPRCTTHKCNSCTLTTLAKQCKHTDILKEIGWYSKLRQRAREDDGWMGVWIFSLFLLSIL